MAGAVKRCGPFDFRVQRCAENNFRVRRCGIVVPWRVKIGGECPEVQTFQPDTWAELYCDHPVGERGRNVNWVRPYAGYPCGGDPGTQLDCFHRNILWPIIPGVELTVAQRCGNENGYVSQTRLWHTELPLPDGSGTFTSYLLWGHGLRTQNYFQFAQESEWAYFWADWGGGECPVSPCVAGDEVTQIGNAPCCGEGGGGFHDVQCGNYSAWGIHANTSLQGAACAGYVQTLYEDFEGIIARIVIKLKWQPTLAELSQSGLEYTMTALMMDPNREASMRWTLAVPGQYIASAAGWELVPGDPNTFAPAAWQGASGIGLDREFKRTESWNGLQPYGAYQVPQKSQLRIDSGEPERYWSIGYQGANAECRDYLPGGNWNEEYEADGRHLWVELQDIGIG